jgi:hypothetical protein
MWRVLSRRGLMKRSRLKGSAKMILASALLALLLPAANRGQARSTPNRFKVCGSLPARCDDPASHELGMMLPKRTKANVTYESESFFAVILMKFAETDDCDEDVEKAEPQRKAIQKLFAGNKVFSVAECPDLDGASYVQEGGGDGGDHYLAIYAGATEAEATEILKRAQAPGKFPKARVSRMHLEYERIEQ